MKRTIKLENDPETGDLMLPLSLDLLDEMGWNIGDTLTWKDLGDGSWSIGKEENGTTEDATKRSRGSDSATPEASE